MRDLIKWAFLPLLVSMPALAQESGETEAGESEAGGRGVVDLEAKLRRLQTRLDEQEVAATSSWPRIRLTGYADVGFFATQGDGSGTRFDAGNHAFPEYRDFAWVFYGDILATAVNSRGEVADLGDLPGAQRMDRIDANGSSSFLVNEVNLTVSAGVSEDVLLVTSVNFTPRSGHDFDLGDAFDIDVAELEWMPTSDHRHSIFVGKVDSVIGNEYRTRKASERIGITPSLLHRYTTGTAIGLKGRSKLLGEHLVVAAALTNGSFGTEDFHFHDETDHNQAKTVSGRLAGKVRVGPGDLEVGASGEYGTQDHGRDGAGALWLAGVDLLYQSPRLTLSGQWLRGGAPGDEMTGAYGLDLREGAYLQAVVFVTSFLALGARGELRDARVWKGDERMYVSRSWRATAGLTLVFGPHITGKLEALHNGEYGGVPQIPNDVVTSSLVVSY